MDMELWRVLVSGVGVDTDLGKAKERSIEFGRNVRINGYFATKLVLDLARCDGIGAVVLDDLGELCKKMLDKRKAKKYNICIPYV